MAAVRSRNTKPEMFVRRGLHRRGFRYRLGAKNMPGRPDLVLPGRSAVIFVHGCFWHGHACHLFRLPHTRREFWEHKIEMNRDRDARVIDELADARWRTGIVWECALRGKLRRNEEEIFGPLATWLLGATSAFEIAGHSCLVPVSGDAGILSDEFYPLAPVEQGR